MEQQDQVIKNLQEEMKLQRLAWFAHLKEVQGRTHNPFVASKIKDQIKILQELL